MRILYLSHLNGHYSSGPTYSVPQQIVAQSEYDDVLWFNAVTTRIEKWRDLSFYRDLNDVAQESISALSEPFNSPDLVIVESFYNMFTSPFIRELIKKEIPYIIIPRCELTRPAQKKKHLKKVLANMIICKRFAAQAIAIEYLTEQEYKDSGDKWNNNHIIIPNAVSSPQRIKTSFGESINLVFIGRIEPYQKGLDLIINAVNDIQDDLRAASCSLIICGADKENKLNKIKTVVIEAGIDDLIRFSDGVYGKDKENQLLSSDVFFLTSRFEGHPMALIEALSYGLPCIATTGTNMRKEVDDYDAGWTADNTSESIKCALLKMIEEKSKFAQKSKNAIKLAQSYYWPEIARRSHDLYVELLNRGEEL